jgi:hypothetical protein
MPHRVVLSLEDNDGEYYLIKTGFAGKPVARLRFAEFSMPIGHFPDCG